VSYESLKEERNPTTMKKKERGNHKVDIWGGAE